MSAAVKVYQEDGFTMVDIKNGTMVDMALELSIYRQRHTLFGQHHQEKQLAIYFGRIEGLDFGASRYACGADFASITEAKVLVLESALNRTYANMMLQMNKPAFPIYTCTSIKQARALLREKHPRASV